MKRPWKKGWILLVLPLLLGLFLLFTKPQTATAANPTTMSFQGKIVNANGTNVTDGTYSFLFKLYSVSSGGSAMWTETQSSVTVTSGVFQVNLGSSCPFFTANACNGSTPIDFNANPNLYLGITFNSDPAGEMSPRVQLQSVPYAYNADRVGGLQVSQLVQLSPGSQQTGFINVSGTINGATLSGGTISGGTLTGSAVNSLNVSGTAISGNGSGLAVSAGGTAQNITIDGSTTGKVQIGATSSGNIEFGGGSGGSGCTLTNSNGNFLCDGTINGATLSGGTISGGTLSSSAVNNLNVSGTAISGNGSGLAVSAGGTAQNLTLDAATSGTISIGGTSTGDISIGGGISSTGCTITNSTGDLGCTGDITGVGGITAGSTSVAGSLVFNDGTANNRSVTLSAPALSSSYSLTLPSSGPAVSQCLQTDSVTASQLVFGSCASIGQKLTQTFSAYSINQGASATTAMNYLVPTNNTAFSIALAGTAEFKAASAGSFRACTLYNSAAVTSGSVSVRFRKNGANVSSTNYCTLDTTNTRSNSQEVASGVETFAAGDTIGVALVSSSLAPTTSEHWATFTIEYGAGGVGPTSLQDAYTNGNSITTTDASDLLFNLANTTTDANFLVNIATSSTGRFAIQNNGSDVFAVASTGALTASSTINGATISGGTLSGTAVNGLNVSSSAVSGAGALAVAAGGTAQNLSLDGSTTGKVQIGAISSGDIELGGGSSLTGCTVTNSNGNFSCSGTINGASLSSTTINNLNVSGTGISGSGTGFTVSAGGTAQVLNLDASTSGTVNIGGTSTGDILLGGGSGGTGCTVTNSNGNFTCTATLSGNSINASSSILLGGNNINSGGTLNNVAYLDQSNNFSSTLQVSNAGGKTTLTLSSTAANTGFTLGGDTNLYRSGANVLSTDDAFQSGGLITAQAGLTILASQNFTVNGESFTDLTGNGLAVSGGALTISLSSSADGLSSTTSSGSGLELLSGGLTLLQGCADNQILKWNESSDLWSCSADNAAGGSISPDSLDFSELADALTLDASTTIGFGGSGFGLTFNNNGSGDLTMNLSSTGDFVIQDNGTPVFTVGDTGNASFVNTVTSGNLVSISDSTASFTGNGLSISASGTTTGKGISVGLGTTLTTGGGLLINSATYSHTGSETGNLVELVFTDNTSSAVTSISNGLRIAPTISATSGSANRIINGLSIEPTQTSCSVGTCTVRGINVGNVTDGTGFTSTGLSIGTGWDVGISIGSGKAVLGTSSSATGSIDFKNATNSNTVTIQSGATSSNYTWTLPDADASGCLASNGSGTLSIAACGDTQQQTFSSSGNYTVPTNALMVIIEGWGGGGGGGGGTGGTTAAVRSGGAGGGGGSYATTIINGSTLGSAGTNIPVTIGTGGSGGGAATDGSAGGTTCFSTSISCAGTLYLQAFGGGGGNGNGTAGNGGGGGGGNQSVGLTNATAATGGTGGGPLGAAAGAQNSGFGGAGGATAAATGAAGGSGSYGGGGGGSSSSTGAGNSGAGGGGVQGGAGGGAGGSCAITTCTIRQGGAGGRVPGTAGGGGTAGTTAGQAGGAGAAGTGSGGDGGGGGANTNVNGGAGGVGGAGGARGGGGGGGGASSGTGTQTPGTGGTGGDGYLRVWTLRGAGADLAEIYCSAKDLAPGTVVTIDESIQNGVKESSRAYDSNTIGIVSTHPGLIIGDSCAGDTKATMVALAGRIPLKISTENGPIKAGDFLTPASQPGYAMKATKAGAIIGQSLTSYSGDGPTYVVAFVKNGQGNGEKLANILPGLDESDQTKTFQQNALAYFSSGKAVSEDKADLSEVLADRVTAGLEVITPSLYANKVSTDEVRGTNNESIKVNLGENGAINFVNKAGETIAIIDSNGNAQFSGTISADKLKVGKIEGLDNAGGLDSTNTNLANSVGSVSSSQASSTTKVENGSFNQLETVNLVSLAQIESKGGLVVDKDAQFNGKTIFNLLAEFNSDANFHGNVSFDNQPSLNNDSGGTALIKSGKQKVNIKFTKPYPEIPIVNLSWNLASDVPEDQIALFDAKYDYYVAKSSRTGFTILLNKPAEQDLQLNWSATSVKNAKISSGEQ